MTLENENTTIWRYYVGVRIDGVREIFIASAGAIPEQYTI